MAYIVANVVVPNIITLTRTPKVVAQNAGVGSAAPTEGQLWPRGTSS